ncbi:putative integral membrane protein (DUF2269) [Fodinibius salinus]|uniref:Putative integral membrane protein (DUF2269) n=2 Tax=Fodinibius salinus TaxID=860790 RepID=A0A5D3YPJ3_9BACT|nr:putative integral membrane protein (DUF2269) [Fodinibius salinus]
MYDVFFWLHIISYFCWLSAFAGSLFYGLKVWQENDLQPQQNFMHFERLVTSIGGHIGALGILISGVALTSMGPYHWGWFRVQLYPWLAAKQVLFIIILVLIPFSIKRSMDFKNKLQNEELSDSAKAESWRKAYRMSLVVYFLVVVDTILGLTKPGLG